MEQELLKRLNKGGVSALTDKALKSSKYYDETVKLNKKKIDIEEFCCLLINREDDYIMYISICNDD